MIEKTVSHFGNIDILINNAGISMRSIFKDLNLSVFTRVMEINFFISNMDDIYNREIYIEFLERIRDEKKFDNPDQLVTQLRQDKKYCLELKKKYE